MSQSNSIGNSSLKMDGSNQLEDDESNAVTDYKYQYQQEISQMMFVFGDVVDPQPAVLQLVEDIVRTQVIEMVIQSKKLATRRSSRNLSPEDLLFLIRYDRAKVNRLRTYLSWKDVRKKAKDSEPGAGGAEPEVEVEDVAVENASKLAPKQVKLPWELSSLYSEHLQPLSSTSLDHNNLEELDVPDEDDIEAHEDSLARLRQADEATKGMTKEEYVHYSECRQASFTFKKAKKFREFINSSNYLEVKPNDDIIDVLGFMAFEVVRELCLGAISLKKEEEEELNGKKTLNDDQGSDREDDEEDEDEDAGDEEEEELEKDEDDTFRTNGNQKLDGTEKGKEEDGTENGGVSVGNESVKTAKGKEESRSSNGKSRKRKVEEDEASSKESNKKTKTENGSSRKSRSISPVKQQRQTSPSKNLPHSPPEDPRSPKKSKKSLSSSSRKMTKSSSSRASEKGPFCSLFLPPENSDRPLLTSHVARAFSRLQKSKIFLQSSTTVMAGGGGLRRTKVFVM